MQLLIKCSPLLIRLQIIGQIMCRCELLIVEGIVYMFQIENMYYQVVCTLHNTHTHTHKRYSRQKR